MKDILILTYITSFNKKLNLDIFKPDLNVIKTVFIMVYFNSDFTTNGSFTAYAFKPA